MPDTLNEDTLNEFEYSPEEQEELKKLDQLNDATDELSDTDPDEEPAPSLDVDDELLDDLVTPDPLAPKDEEAEPETAPESTQEPETAPELEELPNYDAELEEIEQRRIEAQGNVDDTLKQLRDLSDQFDDGEIAQGKYDYERLQLERQLAKHERALNVVENEYQDLNAEATYKITAYEDNRRTVWRNDLIGFLEDPANEVIKGNRHIAEQFDQLLQSMGQSGVFEGLNNQQILQSVRNQLSFRVPELNQTSYKPEPAAKQKPPKPQQNAKVPPTLSQMQTTQVPQDDPFAYVRKLSGVEYEQAISKMSAEQQEQFFYG